MARSQERWIFGVGSDRSVSLPLPASPLERFVMSVDWPFLGGCLMLFLGLMHFSMAVLLPRVPAMTSINNKVVTHKVLDARIVDEQQSVKYPAYPQE